MSIKDNAPDIILGLLWQRDGVATDCFDAKEPYKYNVLIVEGIIDQHIYSKLINWSKTQIINVSYIFYKLGKQNPNIKEAIIEVMRRIREEPITFKHIRVLAIVDRDFDYKEAHNESNLIFTDTSDLETLLLKTHAFDLKSIPGMDPSNARATFCNAYELGIIRQEMFKMIDSDVTNIRYYFSESIIQNHLRRVTNTVVGVSPKKLLSWFSRDKENKLYNSGEFGEIFLNNLINRLKEQDLLNEKGEFKFMPRFFIKSNRKDFWLNVRGHDVISIAFRICRSKDTREELANIVIISKFLAENTNIELLTSTQLFKELREHRFAYYDLGRAAVDFDEFGVKEYFKGERIPKPVKDKHLVNPNPTPEVVEEPEVEEVIETDVSEEIVEPVEKRKPTPTHFKLFEECGLSSRAINCLKRAGYKDIAMVKAASFPTIHNIQNMTEDVYSEILNKIFGLITLGYSHMLQKRNINAFYNPIVMSL